MTKAEIPRDISVLNRVSINKRYSTAELSECFRNAEMEDMARFKAVRDAYVTGELTEAQARAAEKRWGVEALLLGVQIIKGGI